MIFGIIRSRLRSGREFRAGWDLYRVPCDKLQAWARRISLSAPVSRTEALPRPARENVIYGLLCAGLKHKASARPRSAAAAIPHFLDAADALAAAGLGVHSKGIRWCLDAGELVGWAASTPQDFSSMGLASDKAGLPVNMAQQTRPVQEIGRILRPPARLFSRSEKAWNNGRIIFGNLTKMALYVAPSMWEGVSNPSTGCRVSGCRISARKSDLLSSYPAHRHRRRLRRLPPMTKHGRSLSSPEASRNRRVGSIVAEMRRALSAARGKAKASHNGATAGLRSVPASQYALHFRSTASMPKERSSARGAFPRPAHRSAASRNTLP